jgi:hypothetical protein
MLIHKLQLLSLMLRCATPILPPFKTPIAKLKPKPSPILFFLVLSHQKTLKNAYPIREFPFSFFLHRYQSQANLFNYKSNSFMPFLNIRLGNYDVSRLKSH